MAPETETLIALIDSERERVSKVLEAADEQVEKSDEASRQLSRELDAASAGTEQALKTLRRAGLLTAV